MQHAAINSLLSSEGESLQLNLTCVFTAEFVCQTQKIGIVPGRNIAENNFHCFLWAFIFKRTIFGKLWTTSLLIIYRRNTLEKWPGS